MSKERPNRLAQEQREAEAASLVVRLPDADEAERAEIMEWVARSPAHAVAFARAESAWKLGTTGIEALSFDLSPDDQEIFDEAAAPVETGKRISRRGMIVAGAAGAAAAALAAFVPVARMLMPGEQTFETEHGEVREVQLHDGSTLHINTDSKVAIAFTKERRLLRLLRGEASFDVAHDKARPFDVEAGDTLTRAVGTQFTIRRREDYVELTVTEGVVSVRNGQGTEARIAAGHGARIAAGTIAATTLDTLAIEQRTGWQRHMVVFDGLTIGEAVAEFNRYRRAPIVIGNSRIAALRVGGRFRLSESDQFLEALQSGFGVKILRRADGAVEITAGPGAPTAAPL